MDAALWSQGQLTSTPTGGWNGTYWAKGQPQPSLTSAVNSVEGDAQLATTATMTATGVVVRHSPADLVVTANIQAVGERIAPSVLLITTPNATITATPRGNARGRTSGSPNWRATASFFARGYTIKAGDVSLSGPATIQATPRTNSQTSAFLSVSAATTATPHWITRTSTSMSGSALLTGTKGHRITRSATNILTGIATINATPAAATGVKITHQTRALLKATQTRTHTTSALLHIRYTDSHATDALLKATQSRTQTTDALLKATQSRTQTTDALLLAVQNRTQTTDALLKATQVRSHTTAALLKATQGRTHTTDAFLFARRTLPFTTNALLKATKVPYHRTRALLKATRTRTHTTDAFLWAERSIDQTVDALLWKEQQTYHTTSASTMLERAEQHHTSARIWGRVALTHGTNARLLMEFTGSGVLNLPSLQLTGAGVIAGVINHYYPKKSELVLPTLQIRGKGQFIPPAPTPEVATDVYYRNRRVLETAYGWGRRDLTELFNYNPCRCVTDEPVEVGISAQKVDPAFLEWDRKRVLRAAFLAAERRRAREADPNYQKPVWGLPEPTEAQEEALPPEPGQSYTVEPRRGPIASPYGGIKLLPRVEVEEILLEVVRPPQPVVVPEVEPEPVVMEVVHPRQSFHIDLPRPKIQHEASEIRVVAPTPAPAAVEEPAFMPPQPITPVAVEAVEVVDKPVALLDPPRSRGFSVGPRNRRRKH